MSFPEIIKARVAGRALQNQANRAPMATSHRRHQPLESEKIAARAAHSQALSTGKRGGIIEIEMKEAINVCHLIIKVTWAKICLKSK